MDWTARLNQALGYMEDNLEKTVEIEEAARLANCSLFHFCRMFEVVFGTGPAEYVRRRRLSRAALDLAAGKDKVIDVALRYGWESPESFAKAFRRCFGITPSEARQNDIELETWPPIQLAVILKGDKTMKYRIIEKDTIELAGVSLRTTNTDGENMKVIPEFWQENSSNGTATAIGKNCGSMGMFGVCYDYNPKDNSFAYAIAVEKGDHALTDFPGGSVTITIDPATYAVFESRGPMPGAIQAVWKQIYSEWFPASEYEHAGTPDFELYPEQEDPSIDDTSEKYRCEVWIPIKKKGK
ncbi:MAG: AraC family transcriptional regulator [Treponema sp.]|nr:AraC family transcriptional regulator [Treponema sp.]